MSKNNTQRLELTWIGKEKQPKLEPRILIQDPEKSYGDKNSENMLIHGDNLLALKALEQDFAGKIKCVYIDPPFNTGAIFKHFDDGIEHSIWLDLMYRRLKILHTLLSKQGSIFIHLDDNESDYCKIMLDEIFKRENFINRITIDVRSPSAFSTVNPGVFKASEYILWYAKNKEEWERRSIRIPTERDTAYNKFIVNRKLSEEHWQFISLKQAFLEKLNNDKLKIINKFIQDIFANGKNISRQKLTQLIPEIYQLYYYFDLKKISNYLFSKLKEEKIETFKNAVYLYILEKCSYNYSESEFDDFVFENADSVCRDTEISDDGAGKETVEMKYISIENPGKVLKLERTSNLETIFIKDGKQLSFYNKNVDTINNKLTATKLLTNIWTDVSWEGISTEGGVTFKKSKKPEKLIKRCIDLSTNVGDYVLDSFLGSGTTIAVAHKMKRKWIGIELGEHCDSHCLVRMKNVVEGKDKSGITEIVDWSRGSGFKYYDLAKSLLKKDRFENYIINPEYNADMMAAAMAKHEGFKYCPDEEIYWKQGRSSEKDYIFTTTAIVTVEHLDRIYEELAPDESLLICCKSFQKACEDKYSNITIKKIPRMLFGRCEFDKEDYSLNVKSLNIIDMPFEEDSENNGEAGQEPQSLEKPTKSTKDKPKKKDKKNSTKDQLDIFNEEEAE